MLPFHTALIIVNKFGRVINFVRGSRKLGIEQIVLVNMVGLKEKASLNSSNRLQNLNVTLK
ncbi:hypothetical protein DRO97_07030 [Archaeoglobales archaeon]|nr:MAG: hypothetical protein DRO97_07030 [Archaeoglobales archaeon]